MSYHVNQNLISFDFLRRVLHLSSYSIETIKVLPLSRKITRIIPKDAPKSVQLLQSKRIYRPKMPVQPDSFPIDKQSSVAVRKLRTLKPEHFTFRYLYPAENMIVRL